MEMIGQYYLTEKSWSTSRDISHIVVSGAFGLEKPRVVVLLCNNHSEPGEPAIIKKLACLHQTESIHNVRKMGMQ